MGIKLEGLSELMNDINRMNDIDKNSLVKTATDKLLKEMKNNAPFKTGNLKNSIKANVKNGKGVVYSPLKYAWILEYGSKKSTAHLAWWSSTVNDTEADIMQIIEKEVKERYFK